MYAETVSTGESLRYLFKNIYGYYVIERVLMRCVDEQLKQELRAECEANLSHLQNKSLKVKWLELIDLSIRGELLLPEKRDEGRRHDAGGYYND